MMESSSMRLKIKVRENGRWHYYYDIGLRSENPQLSKYVYDKGVLRPRFLEDFIEKYGRENVVILSWGKYWRRRRQIANILRWQNDDHNKSVQKIIDNHR